ncbi:hypothetical protein IWQ60_007168, partial [Tieghemiomyces parasiticus]
MERLNSLCGGKDLQQPLAEHVLGFIPAVITPHGPARNDDVMLRLQSSYDPNGDTRNLSQRQWFLCQQGHPDPHMSTHATVRPVLYSTLDGPDVLKFVSLLGYRYEFGYIQEGTWFVCQDRFKITVSQVFKLNRPSDLSTKTPCLSDGAWLIEVTVQGVTQDQVKRVPDDLAVVKTWLDG